MRLVCCRFGGRNGGGHSGRIGRRNDARLLRAYHAAGFAVAAHQRIATGIRTVRVRIVQADAARLDHRFEGGEPLTFVQDLQFLNKWKATVLRRQIVDGLVLFRLEQATARCTSRLCCCCVGYRSGCAVGGALGVDLYAQRPRWFAAQSQRWPRVVAVTGAARFVGTTALADDVQGAGARIDQARVGAVLAGRSLHGGSCSGCRLGRRRQIVIVLAAAVQARIAARRTDNGGQLEFGPGLERCVRHIGGLAGAAGRQCTAVAELTQTLFER